MARYREKTPDELDWNRIRRGITRALDTVIMNRREEVLNVLLSTAFDKYVKSLETGETIEIEEDYERFVTAIVGDILPPADQVEAGSQATHP